MHIQTHIMSGWLFLSTISLIEKRVKHIFPGASLRAVIEVLGINGDVQHNAFEDAKDAAAVYRRLTKLLAQRPKKEV